MDSKDVFIKLREKAGLSLQELADKLFVTRQAVSRWERGEVLPSSDMLRRLSELFDVSINTLLGSPRRLICQSCGMPLEDGICGHDADGAVNEDFCKWCYDGGQFLQDCTMEEMAATCTEDPCPVARAVALPGAVETGIMPQPVSVPGGRLFFCISMVDKLDGLWYDKFTL